MDDDDRRANLAAMTTPLRQIFWGALICLIDINITSKVNGEGYKFDLLDDTIGMILITLGVFRLSRLNPSRSFNKGMAFVKAVSVLSTIKTVPDHFIFRSAEPWSSLATLLSIAELGALLVFCSAMVSLCRTHGLAEPEASWRRTSLLFLVIYVIPMGLIHVAGLVATMTDKPFRIDVGPIALLYIAVCLIPLIHFFKSTSRMSRAAVQASEA